MRDLLKFVTSMIVFSLIVGPMLGCRSGNGGCSGGSCGGGAAQSWDFPSSPPGPRGNPTFHGGSGTR